jgi:hypothetical protein
MMAALLVAAAVGGTPVEPALAAADAAPVAIFAYRDATGRPTAWPMTPYRDGDAITVTSTLAFMRKTEAVRRDGRVALLAGGWLVQGDARVHADVAGDEFVRALPRCGAAQVPPARDIVAIPAPPAVRLVLRRVFMTVTPVRVTAAPGADQATLITLAADGFPVIAPIARRQMGRRAFRSVPPTARHRAAPRQDAECATCGRCTSTARIAGGASPSNRERLARSGRRRPAGGAARQQLEFRRLGRDGRRRIGRGSDLRRHRCATQLSFWLPASASSTCTAGGAAPSCSPPRGSPSIRRWRPAAPVDVATVAVWIIAVTRDIRVIRGSGVEILQFPVSKSRRR